MPCKRKIQKPLKKNSVGITVGKWDGVSVCEVLEFSTNFHCWDLEILSILLDVYQNYFHCSKTSVNMRLSGMSWKWDGVSECEV